MQTEIITTREVKAVQIPSGDPITLPAGTAVIITQTLGGSFTVATQSGLARISSDDSDALGDPKGESAQDDGLPEDATLEDRVWHQLTQVFDPEIPVDIVNLGLVYDCTLNEVDDGQTTVNIKMTLTAPGCGMGPVIAADAQARVMSIDGIIDATVDLVWDPAWNQDMISEIGRMKLGMV